MTSPISPPGQPAPGVPIQWSDFGGLLSHPDGRVPTMTFDDFATQVNTNWSTAKSDGIAGDRLSGRGLRYGQVFFNTLSTEHPLLAEDIRSTHRDPFHKDEVTAEIWDYCSEKWDTTARSI